MGDPVEHGGPRKSGPKPVGLRPAKPTGTAAMLLVLTDAMLDILEMLENQHDCHGHRRAQIRLLKTKLDNACETWGILEPLPDPAGMGDATPCASRNGN